MDVWEVSAVPRHQHKNLSANGREKAAERADAISNRKLHENFIVQTKLVN